MTRLTMAVSGDPLTFRPVTSSIVRTSKDGSVDVIIMLAGTDYNITMNGILQEDATGDIEPSTQDIDVNNGFLELKAEQKTAGVTIANLVGTFSSFMYFYPGTIIKGHIMLDETSHGVPVPELEATYHFKDLLSNDEILFRLIREENNLKFEFVEIVDSVENIIFTIALAGGVDEYFFEFRFLKDGKSKLLRIDDWKLSTQDKVRVWIGDIKAKIGECNVSAHLHNIEETLHTMSSDFLFIDYPLVFLKFDRTSAQRLIGRIRLYDDLNDPVEANWREIRSRDYKFEGNRIIENGMIRIIIKTVNPIIEIWGWNYENVSPTWELALTFVPDTDSGLPSLKVQNLVFEYFSYDQLKCSVNFGTSLYSFIMSRGDPYITMLNTGKTKFKIQSAKDRFVGDFKDQHNGYTLKNTDESGNPDTLKATGTATTVSVIGEVNAFGTVTCASAIAADTVTVNGLLYTAVAGAKADNTEFSIDTGDNETATDLADSINNDTRTGTLDDLTATSSTDVVTIVQTVGGTGGNATTLVSSDGTTLAVSGATFSGGVNGDTITVNGLVYTAVVGTKADNTEFSVDTGDNETAIDLADSLTNDIRIGTDDADIRAKGSAASNVVTITAEAGGTSGNSITMSETGTTITLSGANLTGGAGTGGTGIETVSNFLMHDNWFGFYNTGALNETVGWMSNIVKPTTIDISDLITKLEYNFVYPITGGIFALGVMPSFPSSLVGGVPFPFVVASQDKYVKWRANEAVLAFREAESIKRR